MSKKRYRSPFLMDLEPGDDPGIGFGGSQGSSGYDSQWIFQGISEDDLYMIELNCDDLDLNDMDTNDDYIITQEEFDIWLTARGGW